MRYMKPSILNVKKASSVIMGARKSSGNKDSNMPGSTISAYRSEE
jgi:hypothetical protein